VSKLEEQKALPRRKLFRQRELLSGLLADVLIVRAQQKAIVAPKRKAKKAKGKR